MLIIGCGDIGLRIAQQANPERTLIGTVRSEDSEKALITAGIEAIRLDLDEPFEFPDISPQAQWVYTMPPQRQGLHDERLRAWLAATPPHQVPSRIVYISTSGVYGDHGGDWVTEETPPTPITERATRRVDAEQQLTHWCDEHKVDLIIFRVPGIVGPGRYPLERLRSGEPLIHPDEAPYTNLIHADQLAHLCLFCLSKAPAGIYNVSDGEPVKVTEYYIKLCEQEEIPVPGFMSMAEAAERYSPMRMSFLNESRRLDISKLRSIKGD